MLDGGIGNIEEVLLDRFFKDGVFDEGGNLSKNPSDDES